MVVNKYVCFPVKNAQNCQDCQFNFIVSYIQQKQMLILSDWTLLKKNPSRKNVFNMWQVI
jgi:hypothetical protein